jgi:hypothetical protein
LPPWQPWSDKISRTRLSGISESSSTRRRISPLNGSSFDGTGRRAYVGGSSDRSAARMVLRARPRRRDRLDAQPFGEVQSPDLGPLVHVDHSFPLVGSDGRAGSPLRALKSRKEAQGRSRFDRPRGVKIQRATTLPGRRSPIRCQHPRPSTPSRGVVARPRPCPIRPWRRRRHNRLLERSIDRWVNDLTSTIRTRMTDLSPRSVEARGGSQPHEVNPRGSLYRRTSPRCVAR